MAFPHTVLATSVRTPFLKAAFHAPFSILRACTRKRNLSVSGQTHPSRPHGNMAN